MKKVGAFLLLLVLSVNLAAQQQGYPFIPLDGVFSRVRENFRMEGKVPSTTELLALGFKKKNDVEFQIETDAGTLYYLPLGTKGFQMAWNPKNPFPVISEAVLSSLINKSVRVETIGRERLNLILTETTARGIGFKESLTVGLDGKHYATLVSGFIP